MNYLEQFFASQIDVRYNAKTKSYSVVRLNADPNKVLYKDGRYRTTTNSEIQEALSQ